MYIYILLLRALQRSAMNPEARTLHDLQGASMPALFRSDPCGLLHAAVGPFHESNCWILTVPLLGIESMEGLGSPQAAPPPPPPIWPTEAFSRS